MKERKEIKVSPRAMESAMILRLFKDALESERPIVSRMRWDPEQGEGPELELGPLEPHPSFGDSRQAASRVGSRVAALVSGEKGEGDKKPVLRLRSEDGSTLDFSMESFDGATLAEDGRLMIMAGALDGELGARVDMPLAIEAALRLYGASGAPLRRDQALFPIRELVDIRRERETQALMSAASDDPMEEFRASPRDFLAAPPQRPESGSGWGSAGEGPLAASISSESGAPAPHWGSRPRRRASDALEPAPAEDAPPAAGSSERGGAELGVFGERHGDWPAPGDGAEEAMSARSARDLLLAAFAEPEPAAAEDEAAKARARALMEEAIARTQEHLGGALKAPLAQAEGLPPARDFPEERPAALGARAEPTSLVAAESGPEKPAFERVVLVSGVPAKGAPPPARAPASLKEVSFLPVAFEPAPQGHDEIAFSVEPADLPGLLEMLAESPEFEARLTHQQGARMRLSLAAPKGSLAAFNPLVERYAKSGVMIRRSKGR